MTQHPIAPLEITEYDLTGCNTFINGYTLTATIKAVEYNAPGCPFVLGIQPNIVAELGDYVEATFSVFTNECALPIDDAEVTFTFGSMTKTTEDYSILTSGNTMVIRFSPDDLGGSTLTHDYTATITTTDSKVYEMTGTVIVEESGEFFRTFGMTQDPTKRVAGLVPDNTYERVVGVVPVVPADTYERVVGKLQEININ